MLQTCNQSTEISQATMKLISSTLWLMDRRIPKLSTGEADYDDCHNFESHQHPQHLWNQEQQ
jgi:hypothetical protein